MRLVTAALTIAAFAIGIIGETPQSRAQDLGTLCTSDTTPADKQIDACNKIIAMKRFSGAQLATIYFWRAVAYNKKGDYKRVIADATISLVARRSE
jgi:hypothetical protein